MKQLEPKTFIDKHLLFYYLFLLVSSFPFAGNTDSRERPTSKKTNGFIMVEKRQKEITVTAIVSEHKDGNICRLLGLKVFGLVVSTVYGISLSTDSNSCNFLSFIVSFINC